MAGAVWGIDIGKAALKAVKLRATKEGLEIKAVEHIDYEGAVGDEEKRPEQVREAMKAFTAKHKVGGDRVLVALPGLHAFSRFIKLPPVDAKKIGLMVRMEAQQQIPFPISEVNWDWQKIERNYAPGEEVEIGIFATQRERITGFLSELQQAGVEPGLITVAPLSIYNFLVYNHEPAEDETIVALDIGSDHTDLVVVSGPRFWLRNLRIAGNDITKALAERFKVSFEEAEKLKRNASKSDQAKKIFSSMEPTLKDLKSEVERSLVFFKSQAPGGELKPSKMILLGDGSKLKNLPSFFEKELGYPVEKVQKLEQDKFVLDPEVDVEMLKKHLLGFGVALGLAIQGAGKAKCAINLAPDDIKVNEELRRKVPWAAGAAACAWAAFGLSYVTWSGWTAKLADTVKSANKVADYNKIQDEVKKVEADGKAKETRGEPLKGLVTNRTVPLDLLNEIRKILPRDNGKIPSLTPQEQELPLERQRELIQQRRAQMNCDGRLWVLDLSIEKKPAGPNPAGPPEAPPTPEGVYIVNIMVAKHQPPTAQAEAIRQAIKNEFVKPLTEALKGAPYYMKAADKYTPDAFLSNNASVADEIVLENRPLSHLDASQGGPVQRKDQFPVLAVPLRFEVGVAPPAPPTPPAEQKGN